MLFIYGGGVAELVARPPTNPKVSVQISACPYINVNCTLKKFEFSEDLRSCRCIKPKLDHIVTVQHVIGYRS